ncbi:NAD(P)/FAD-dependent oxidoreductase [Streptomyces sp. NPDC059740]|uniref:NAD(P)/FAD-dependent oxidoreductase n=1 Tax=Streptomyces sp. NPDC059740 TaxID=3346926 RepID=UPI00365CD427
MSTAATPSRTGRIAVVGASAAGLAAAEALRRFGWTGELTLVGDEKHPPYDRPPLSKQLLGGDWEAERLHLRAPGQLAELDLDVRLGTPATALDAETRTVTLASGEQLACDGVIVATGVRARTLPGTEGLAGVHTLRTLEDALALRGALTAGGGRLVVVGNGVLGCEAAAVARKLGHEVTLVGREPVPMVAVVGAEVGALLADEHRAQGVTLMTGDVDGFEAAEGRVSAVRLADGAVLPADTVLVAVGSQPAVEWLAASGLPDLTDGVGCDAYCAAAPGVYAAGDVARWEHPVYGRPLRVEHRMNATEQGLAAARNLYADLVPEEGERREFAPVPYFWSDQYGLKLQAYGLLAGAEQVEATVLDAEARRVIAFYGDRERVTGVAAIGLTPRQTRTLRSLVARPSDWAQVREAREALLAPTA